jgi:hypothetical protein
MEGPDSGTVWEPVSSGMQQGTSDRVERSDSGLPQSTVMHMTYRSERELTFPQKQLTKATEAAGVLLHRGRCVPGENRNNKKGGCLVRLTGPQITSNDQVVEMRSES